MEKTNIKTNMSLYFIRNFASGKLSLRNNLFVLYSFLCLMFFVPVLSGFVLSAAGSVSNSFKSDDNLYAGALVGVDSSREGYVKLSSSTTSDHLIGVVTKADNSLVSINSEDDNVVVAVSGLTNAFVSDINGKIIAGDAIAKSPISGIGAKARPGDQIVGVAQSDLSTAAELTKKTIQDSEGKDHEVSIGTIPVLIAVGAYSTGGSDNVNLGYISNLANKIAGKPVSISRIVFSGVIGLAAIISLAVIIYSSVYNSVGAVGRNPLARPAIFEALAQVMALVMVISILSVVIIYVVIRI